MAVIMASVTVWYTSALEVFSFVDIEVASSTLVFRDRAKLATRYGPESAPVFDSVYESNARTAPIMHLTPVRCKRFFQEFCVPPYRGMIEGYGKENPA
jgi:hypothetical protein